MHCIRVAVRGTIPYKVRKAHKAVRMRTRVAKIEKFPVLYASNTALPTVILGDFNVDVLSEPDSD